MVKIFSNLRQDGGVRRVLQFPPVIKWKPRYNWNMVESGVKHHNPLLLLNTVLSKKYQKVPKSNRKIIERGRNWHTNTSAMFHMWVQCQHWHETHHLLFLQHFVFVKCCKDSEKINNSGLNIFICWQDWLIIAW